VSRDRQRIDPQTAVRVAVIGGLALLLFSLLFLRLWTLQVLRGAEALGEARQNRTRSVPEPAARGDIVDRRGRRLVASRLVPVVQIDPRELSQAERDLAADWGRRAGLRARRPRGRRGRLVRIPDPVDPRLARTLRRLSRILGTPRHDLHARVVAGLAQVPYANVTLTERIGRAELLYLAERRHLLPAMVIAERPRRVYPHGSLAAHLLGTTGELTPRQRVLDRFDGVRRGTVVGQDGVEWSYDTALRGTDGLRRYTVDANGSPIGQRLAREPRSGHRLRLSIDLELQRAGERALRRAIAASGGKAGAFVALDPVDGAILAMGSAPTFDPRRLQRPLTARQYERLLGHSAQTPTFQRSIGAAYPTGSVFKPITAIAGQAAGVLDAGTLVDDDGCVEIGGRRFCNAGEEPHGTVDLREAMKVSSDVYFYVAGRDMEGARGRALQRASRELGLGRRTGVDLPGEFRGLVPDREWRARVARLEAACERRRRIAFPPGCGISDKRPWSVGDNVNLSVGQGDLQATPLQMAVTYAAVANGGRIVRPHVGASVEDASGSELERVDPPARRRVKLDSATLEAVRAGLRASTSEPGGTSSDVFAGWPHDRLPVHGKTGTAERPPDLDQSWYAAYVPHRTRPLVVVTTVEEGGFGAEAAAPAARLLLSEWYGVPPRFVAGRSRTR